MDNNKIKLTHDQIEILVDEWVEDFKNIDSKTKTNLRFGFQEGIYKVKELIQSNKINL